EPQRDPFAPGSGQERHVPEDGGGLHPRSREGEELADPEQREVAMPQGGERDGDSAHRYLIVAPTSPAIAPSVVCAAFSPSRKSLSRSEEHTSELQSRAQISY